MKWVQNRMTIFSSYYCIVENSSFCAGIVVESGQKCENDSCLALTDQISSGSGEGPKSHQPHPPPILVALVKRVLKKWPPHLVIFCPCPQDQISGYATANANCILIEHYYYYMLNTSCYKCNETCLFCAAGGFNEPIFILSFAQSTKCPPVWQ